MLQGQFPTLSIVRLIVPPVVQLEYALVAQFQPAVVLAVRPLRGSNIANLRDRTNITTPALFPDKFPALQGRSHHYSPLRD